jgi:DNA-binding CsgD family transcriptional regulator
MTPRQKETLDLLCKGFSNDEIARIMDITPRTVKAHCKALFWEFRVENRQQLLVEMIERLR